MRYFPDICTFGFSSPILMGGAVGYFAPHVAVILKPRAMASSH